MEEPYQNREIDEMFSDIQKSLDRIEIQTSKTNGRVTKLEKILLITATVILVLLLTNRSELLEIFKVLI